MMINRLSEDSIDLPSSLLVPTVYWNIVHRNIFRSFISCCIKERERDIRGFSNFIVHLAESAKFNFISLCYITKYLISHWILLKRIALKVKGLRRAKSHYIRANLDERESTRLLKREILTARSYNKGNTCTVKMYLMVIALLNWQLFIETIFGPLNR